MSGNSGAVRAGRAFVELFADNSRLAADLKRGVSLLRSYAATTRAIGQSMVSQGVKLATPFALATAIFVGFQDEMAAVRSVTQATAADFGMLTEQAKELGRTTSYTAKQVAGAQTELGRAGFNPSQIRQSTASVLALARGTRTELADAAQIGADSLRAFRLEARLMPQVGDILVATANNSSQGLADLFEALKTVGPVAADVGTSMADTAAAIGVLANNGIKGTLAGNAMKRAYLNLANPAIRKKIEELTGVSAVDSAGSLRPLASVITDIGKATAGLPNARKLDIFSQIFGDRAIVAASAFAGSAANFDDLQSVLNNAGGTAARTASMMDDTLGGSLRMLMSAAEGVAIAVGETVAPAVRSLADIVTTAAGKLTEFVTGNRELILGLAATAAAAVLTGGALIAIGGTISGLASVAAASLGFIPGLMKAIVSPARLAMASILAVASLTGLSGQAVAGPTIRPAVEQVASPDPVDVSAKSPAPVDVETTRKETTVSEHREATGETPAIDLSGVAEGGKAATASILPLVASFGGLRVARGLVGGVVGSLATVPAVAKRGQIALIANSTAARQMGSTVGRASKLIGRTLAGGISVAHGATRALTAGSLSLSATLAKTGGILLGKTATGLDAASGAAVGMAKRLGTAGKAFTSTGRAAVLASTALVRSAGRGSSGIWEMGRVSRRVTLDLGRLTRAIVSVTAARSVAGLKATTQAIGGLAITGYRTTKSMLRVAASIRLASIAGAAATGFAKAATGMRALSMGALLASRNLGKAAKSVRSMMVLSKIGGLAMAAASAVSAAAGVVFAVATSPVALFAGLAAGIVAASIWAVGGFDAMAGGLASLVRDGGQLFGRLASQAGTAWNAVSAVATRSIGAIVQRVKAGDIQGAWKIAMAALSLAWAETVNAFASTWAPVKVALVNGWQATSKLFGDYFGGAIRFVKSAFATFLSWFSGPGGAGSVSITTASIVGNVAKMWARGWSAVEGFATEATDFMADGWDVFMTRITNAWHSAISFIQRAWTRLKGLFDSDIDVEAEVADINREEKAHNSANEAERDRTINERADKREQAEQQREADLQGQLDEIDADTMKKAEQERQQVAAEQASSEAAVQKRRIEFEVSLIDADITDTTGQIAQLEEQLGDLNAEAELGLTVDTSEVEAKLAAARSKLSELEAKRETLTGVPSPVDAVGTVSKPAAAAAEEEPVAPEPPKSSTELLIDWKAKRDKRDQLKEELSEVNRSGEEVNPRTGRSKKTIKEEFVAASEETNDALSSVRQARAEEFKAARAAKREKNAAAAKARNGRNKEMTEATAETVKPTAEKARGASEGLARIEARMTTSTGSFSGRAASQMGASTTVMNRVAKAVEDSLELEKQTAANTAKSAEALENLDFGMEAD